MSLTDEELEFLENKANEIREDIIKTLLNAGSGHSAGPLGMADVMTALYFHVMNHDPDNPDWEERDRMVLSNGHICPGLYVTLAHAGYFPREELKTLRELGTRLQGHPHNVVTPGIENSSGPLGHGLSQACGMAKAALMDDKDWHVYCLMSDGEQEEGNTWEAAMFAGNNELRNLTAIMDRNNIQIDGYTEHVMPLEPLREKYESFGWHVQEVDGHNIREIIDAINESKAIYEKPSMIIAHTIPGKGVDFMEKDYHWHGKPPNEEQAQKALEQLHKIRTLQGEITGEHE